MFFTHAFPKNVRTFCHFAILFGCSPISLFLSHPFNHITITLLILTLEQSILMSWCFFFLVRPSNIKSFIYLYISFISYLVVIMAEYIWVYECAKHVELFKDMNTGCVLRFRQTICHSWWVYMIQEPCTHICLNSYAKCQECQLKKRKTKEKMRKRDSLSSENHTSKNILDGNWKKSIYSYQN